MRPLGDDPELLKFMLEDLAKAPPAYRPTSYWQPYVDSIAAELLAQGLTKFRRRRGSLLGTFGGDDLPWGYHRRTPSDWAHPLNWVVKSLCHRLADAPPGLLAKLRDYLFQVGTGFDSQDLFRISVDACRYEAAASKGPKLEDWSPPRQGDPEVSYPYRDKLYTFADLYYFHLYALSRRWIDFDSLGTMAELGSGAGRHLQLVHALHPKLTLLAFDIPPQIYVAEQWAKSSFPEDVISYRETRTWTEIPELPPGKIVFLAASKLEELKGWSWDLFWSSASLQEMEPDVVANYLAHTIPATRSWAFLHQVMAGKEVDAEGVGHGVREATTLAHYQAGLADLEVLARAPNPHPLGAGRGYEFLVARRS